MRFSLRHYSLWIAAILLVATTSCSDNDEPDSVDYESLSGVWYGTRCYNNNGAVKYQNITLTLNQDKTGSMEYESDVSFSAARFTWSISGDRLICQGAYASTSGDISGSYNLECRIEKDRLYPTGQFSYFILTKDNSVMTDGEGNEIASAEDQLYMLQNVWVSTDKKSVIEFYPGGEYDEYVLSYPGSGDYTEFNTGKYQFNPLLKTLTVNATLWEVVTLDSENLVLKKGTTTLSYTIGSRNDIPTQSDLKAYLSSAMGWSDSESKYFFQFSSDGSVRYIEDSGRRYGSYGDISLSANGTYSVSGSTVTCYFSDVFWEYGTSGTSAWFPGWVCNQSCTKRYVIEVTPSTSIKVTFPDSRTEYLDKL